MARPERDVKLFTYFQPQVRVGADRFRSAEVLFEPKIYVLPDGYIITVAQKVPVSQKCCSSQILLVHEPAESTTLISR